MEADIDTYLAPFLKAEPLSQRESLIHDKWLLRKTSSLTKKEEKPSSTSQAKELTLPDAEATTVDLVQSPFITHPEVDEDDLKYEACFECGKKVGRLLQYCPKCQAVAFCSVKCNEVNTKKGSVHKCGLNFYGNPAYQSVGRTIIGKWHYSSDEDVSTAGETEFTAGSLSDIDAKVSKSSGATKKSSKMSGATGKGSKATSGSLQPIGDGGDSEAESDGSRWIAGEVSFHGAEDGGSGKTKRKSKGSKYTMSEDGSSDMFGMKRRGDSYVKKSRFSVEEQSVTESIVLKKGKKTKKRKDDDGDSDEDDMLAKRSHKKNKAQGGQQGKKSKRDASEDEGKKTKKRKDDDGDSDEDDTLAKRSDKKNKAQGGQKGKKSKRDASEDEIGAKAGAKGKKAKRDTSDVEDLGGDKKGGSKGKAERVKKGKYDESDDEKGGVKAERKSRKDKTGKSEIDDVDGGKKGVKKSKVKEKRDESGDTKDGKNRVKGEKKKKGKPGDIEDKPVGKSKPKIEKTGKGKTVDGKEGVEKTRKHKVEDKKATKGGEKEGLRSKSKDKRADQNKALNKGMKAETLATNAPRGRSKEPQGREGELKRIAEAQTQRKEEEKLKFIDKYGREVTMSRIGSRGEPIKEKVKLFPEHLRMYLLQACTNLGLDLDNLMLPYTVLRDGQLYYRLYGPEPLFTENYSLI